MSSTPAIPEWALEKARDLCGNCLGKGFTQVDGTTTSFRFDCGDCPEIAHALAETRANALEEAAKTLDREGLGAAINATHMAKEIRALKTKSPISSPVDTPQS